MSGPFQQQSRTVYQDYQRHLSPTALLGPVGAAYQAAYGAVKDAQLERFIQAVKAKFPGSAPSDALAAIGAERSIPRGGSESDISYAARLLDAWNTWPWAGTAFGLLRAFFATGYTNVVLAQVVGAKQFTLDGSGNLVTVNGGTWTPSFFGDPFWSRFDVLFPTPLPAAWVSGGVPSSSSIEANFIRALISAWKPAHATYTRIIIITAGRVLGYPHRTLGAGNGVLGGNSTVVWSP